MTDTSINREHKDRLFTILFGRSENKAWALDLYNAMNGSHYDNLDDIEVTTMEDTLYMGMKNGKRVLPIPIPKLVVFYNGIDKDVEDEQYLYLAD